MGVAESRLAQLRVDGVDMDAARRRAMMAVDAHPLVAQAKAARAAATTASSRAEAERRLCNARQLAINRYTSFMFQEMYKQGVGALAACSETSRRLCHPELMESRLAGLSAIDVVKQLVRLHFGHSNGE